MKNVNKKRRTESDIIIFKDCDSTVGALRNTEDIGVKEVKMHPARFCFISARTKSKKVYASDSLKCIQASISIYLSDGEH
jgi:hypothetical protein